MSGPAILHVQLRRLWLRHTWTTTMASSAYRDTVHLSYSKEGFTGYGEGAPIARYGRTPEVVKADLEGIAPWLSEQDPMSFRPLLASARERLGSFNGAALAAIDIALRDWHAQRLGVPLRNVLGLSVESPAISSVSIGIDTPEVIAEKVREMADFPVLKIKVGLDNDEEVLHAVRAVTAKPLRVDANEGWRDPELAIRRIRWLETMGVELIEQPMPAGMTDEMRYVRSRVRMPLYADEACTSAQSIPALQGAYDGINVKLDKAGGITEAMRWIDVARSCELRVMIGCMVSSSCSCTAAAQLAPLADLCDVDGALLLRDDPFTGMSLPAGQIVLAGGLPGLGARPATHSSQG